MQTISIENLYQYMEALKESPGLSLNDFIGDVADFSEIIFDESHQVDLRGANLAACNLNGANFNEFVKLKGADLRGALLKGAMFTDQIDLAGVKFGYLDLALHAKVFKNCRLKNAEYTPSDKVIKEVAVTEKIIVSFRQHGAGKSLNEYLAGQGQNKGYKKVIADFSEFVVDEQCNGLNFSGSKFVGTVFKGRIKNVALRDCLFDRIKPSEGCVLEDSDLRGTCLTEGRDRNVDFHGNDLEEILGFSSIENDYNITLINPTLSITSPQHSSNYTVSLDSAKRAISVISSQHLLQYTVQGDATFDPCYKRGSNEGVKKLREATLADLDQNPIEGFDFAHMDLRGMKLEGKNFTNCNFSHCQLSGVKFKGAIFNTCNFTGADFSKKWLGLRGGAELQKVQAYDCDFTSADLTGVDAKGSTLENLRAINVTANGNGLLWGMIPLGGKLELEKSLADDANFAGSYMPGIKAKGIKAARVNFAEANCDSGDFTRAKLPYANFYQTSLRNSILNKTELKYSRLTADASNAHMIDTLVEGADLADFFYETLAVKSLRGKPIESEVVLNIKILQAEQDVKRAIRKTEKLIMLTLVVLAVIVAVSVPSISIVANYTAVFLFGSYVIDTMTKEASNMLPECLRKKLPDNLCKRITDVVPGVEVKQHINASVVDKSEAKINLSNEKKGALKRQQNILDKKVINNPEILVKKRKMEEATKSVDHDTKSIQTKMSYVKVGPQRKIMKPSIEDLILSRKKLKYITKGNNI